MIDVVALDLRSVLRSRRISNGRPAAMLCCLAHETMALRGGRQAECAAWGVGAQGQETQQRPGNLGAVMTHEMDSGKGRRVLQQQVEASRRATTALRRGARCLGPAATLGLAHLLTAQGIRRRTQGWRRGCRGATSEGLGAQLSGGGAG